MQGGGVPQSDCVLCMLGAIQSVSLARTNQAAAGEVEFCDAIQLANGGWQGEARVARQRDIAAIGLHSNDLKRQFT